MIDSPEGIKCHIYTKILCDSDIRPWTRDVRLEGGMAGDYINKVTGCELRVMNSKPKTRNTELETSIKAKPEVQYLNCG
jgi:hypothetical protein